MTTEIAETIVDTTANEPLPPATRQGFLPTLVKGSSRLVRELLGFVVTYDFWKALLVNALGAASMAFGQGIIKYFGQKCDMDVRDAHVKSAQPASPASGAFSGTTPRSFYGNQPPAPPPYGHSRPTHGRTEGLGFGSDRWPGT